MPKLTALLLVLLLSACAAPPPPRDDSLYQALGGMDGITVLVEELLLRIAEDERIVHHFLDSDIDRLNEKLIEQICFESGGPCTYTGDSMPDSHAGMDITEAGFNALVEDLIDAMDALRLSVTTQNRLLARLAPMRGEIIYR